MSYTIIVIAVLSILPTIGVKLSGLLVAGGIAGLAIGFASQSIIGNLISGIFLMIERPIKIGNSVNIEDIGGIVEDIRIISTTIRTFDGLYVRVPNQKVFTSGITNFVANVARRFEYVVGIRYSDDADKALEIIKNIIDEHPLALQDPAPRVFVDNLGESSVNIVVRIWAPATEWFGVKTELLWKIKKALEKAAEATNKEFEEQNKDLEKKHSKCREAEGDLSKRTELANQNALKARKAEGQIKEAQNARNLVARAEEVSKEDANITNDLRGKQRVQREKSKENRDHLRAQLMNTKLSFEMGF